MRLLSSSYYFELHDLLKLLSMLKGIYNIKLPIKLNTKSNAGLLLIKKSSIDKKKFRQESLTKSFGKELVNF